jgi:hypothetical protein
MRMAFRPATIAKSFDMHRLAVFRVPSQRRRAARLGECSGATPVCDGS